MSLIGHRAGVKADFSHAGTTSSMPYDVDAAIMPLERHERGVASMPYGQPGKTSPVTEVLGYHTGTRENAVREPSAPD
jgi:hypothetical protein